MPPVSFTDSIFYKKNKAHRKDINAVLCDSLVDTVSQNTAIHSVMSKE